MWEMMEGLVLEPCKRDEYVSSSICRSARSNGSHLTKVPYAGWMCGARVCGSEPL